MIAIVERQLARALIFSACSVATASLGCTPPPTAAAPANPAGASLKGPPGSPAIVGTVRIASTGQAPPGGGVVYLEDAPREPDVATAAAIDVYHKEFFPFISVITTGGAVTFGNRDALTHHVFSPDLPKWDTGYIRKDGTASKTFDKPGAITLLCNIHPEMIGYVLVVPSSYFGKLAPDGTYVIANVPAGTYRATAWVPRVPIATQPVTVSGTNAVTANFELGAATGAN
jgi:plastocyanin